MSPETTCARRRRRKERENESEGKDWEQMEVEAKREGRAKEARGEDGAATDVTTPAR